MNLSAVVYLCHAAVQRVLLFDIRDYQSSRVDIPNQVKMLVFRQKVKNSLNIIRTIQYVKYQSMYQSMCHTILIEKSTMEILLSPL